jgi:hypothetical protein
LVNGCIQDNTDAVGNSWINTGLIVSSAAFREVFGGNYTSQVQQTEFTELSVTSKEFRDTVWVRVPGLDAHTLANRAGSPAANGVAGSDGRDAAADSGAVNNYVGGSMINSVQIRSVKDGINFGWRHG